MPASGADPLQDPENGPKASPSSSDPSTADSSSAPATLLETKEETGSPLPPFTETLPEFPLRDDLVKDGYFILKHSSLDSGGRCLARRSKITAGSILFREFPVTAALRPDQLRLRCHFCWLPPTDQNQRLKRCGSCQTVRYCSVKCQRKHWAPKEAGDHAIPGGHQLECKVFKSIQARMKTKTKKESESVPKQKQESKKELKPVDQSPINLPVTMMTLRLWLYQTAASPEQKSRALRRFEALSHRLEAHTEDQKMDYSQIVQALNGWLENSEVVPKGDGDEAVEQRRVRSKTLFSWMGRLNVNAHTITTEDFMTIGAGIYPCLSMMNHSCRPNCSFVFYGPYVEVRAIRDVDPEEPLCISYIDVAQSTERRQAELLKNYFFRCSCKLCVPPAGTTDVSARDEMLTHSDPATLDPDTLKKLKSLMDNPEGIDGGVRVAHIRQALRILDEELRVGPGHQDRHTLLRELANLLIFEGRWSEALESANQLLESSEMVYGKELDSLHPMLGLDRLMVTRLRDYQATMPNSDDHQMDPVKAVGVAIENLTRNIELYQAALKILNITHGERINVVRDAHTALQRSQQELGFMRQQQRRQGGGSSAPTLQQQPTSTAPRTIEGPPKIEVIKD